MGRYWALFTSPGWLTSYCWTVWLGPRVKRVARGPKLASARTPSTVGISSQEICFVLTSQIQVSLRDQLTSTYALRAGMEARGKSRCGSTYPSEYCKILPFFDHASQLRHGSTLSLLFRIRMVFGCSAVGGFETLQTRRSPSIVWDANISDRCFVDDACHDRLTIGEGARGVVKV